MQTKKVLQKEKEGTLIDYLNSQIIKIKKKITIKSYGRCLTIFKQIAVQPRINYSTS